MSAKWTSAVLGVATGLWPVGLGFIQTSRRDARCYAYGMSQTPPNGIHQWMNLQSVQRLIVAVVGFGGLLIAGDPEFNAEVRRALNICTKATVMALSRTFAPFAILV